MRTPYASRLVPSAWAAAGWAGVGYGVFLTVVALRSPPGEALTGQWVGQPLFKSAMALLLMIAAVGHPIAREARWLIPALGLSAAGDWLLAIPWWEPSFVAGLTAFLLAHLCYLAALVPLVVVSRGRLVGVGLIGVSCLAILIWLWPGMAREGMTVPVTVYMLVLGAMVCVALLAQLPTRWTAIGAGCFAVSDAMIGISQFVLGNELLAVPIWWAYAAAQLMITAGFFFDRNTGDRQPASA
ncbi:lysoplasmalogenase [Mycolicibacter minnesotensis]